MNNPSLGKKKLLENSWLNSLSIPLLIVLLGASIIFGISKILSTDQSYKDLVRELNSKSFGNKWVSAYELSKVINSSRIKKEDIPWLVENLVSVYKGSSDGRTKQFVIVALGALKSPAAIEIYSDVLANHIDKLDVVLQTLIALSKLDNLQNFNVSLFKPILKFDDIIIKQTLFFVIAKFKIIDYEESLITSLTSDNTYLRFSAATALIMFKNIKTIPVIKNILKLTRSSVNHKLTLNQRVLLVGNVLTGIRKTKWKILKEEITYIAVNEANLRLRDQARKILK